MTYVDENGASVYGQRIRNLGESMAFIRFIAHRANSIATSELGITRSLVSAPCTVKAHFGILSYECTLGNARDL